MDAWSRNLPTFQELTASGEPTMMTTSVGCEHRSILFDPVNQD